MTKMPWPIILLLIATVAWFARRNWKIVAGTVATLLTIDKLGVEINASAQRPAVSGSAICLQTFPTVSAVECLSCRIDLRQFHKRPFVQFLKGFSQRKSERRNTVLYRHWRKGYYFSRD